MTGLLVWLNGPGLRWLSPLAAEHFLGQSGVRTSFKVEGSLSRGVVIRDLKITTDGAIASLSVARLEPRYQFSELRRGRIRGVEIDDLHLELRLGLEGEGTQTTDLEQIVQSIRDAREKIMPYSIALRGFTLNATRGGKRVVSLGPSELNHGEEADDFSLSLGILTDATGREWPAQQATIQWEADEIRVDQLDPLPGIGVRNLRLALPETGVPEADLELRADDAVFHIGASPGFSSVAIELREGRLESRKLAERFGLQLPVDAELSSFALNVDELMPEPRLATGSSQLLLENIAAGDWVIAELSVDLGLQKDRLSLATRGKLAGAVFSISAEAPLTRNEGSPLVDQIAGRFSVESVPDMVLALSERIAAMDPEVAVPQAAAEGVFDLELENFIPRRAAAELMVRPENPDEASPISIRARWQHGNTLDADVELTGMKAKVNGNLTDLSYDASAVFEDFSSARIDRWLEIFRASTNGRFDLAGEWSGGGSIRNTLHRGELSLTRFSFNQAEQPPIQAQGRIRYDWPGEFSTQNLSLVSQQQTITADVRLANGVLKLKDLLWRKDDLEIAMGSATLPMPDDFSKWRDTLIHDRRPLEVDLQTQRLSLELLKDWLPATSRLDAGASGQATLKISGTYAEPMIEALVDAKNLRSREQEGLPPADLRVRLAASDELLTLEGNATAPDLPPAVFTASMPFRPATWAENPGSVLEETIVARADLPRLELARYASLIPAARTVQGVVTGHVQVAGTLSKPEVMGLLQLQEGGLELKQERMPALTGIAATVDFSPARVAMRELRAESAGGTLRGAGSVELDDWKPAKIDFQLTGRHLPVVRNDSMIVRAHADLRLAGNFADAEITGNISVVDSLFYRDIEILPMGVPFTTPSAAALPRIDPPSNPATQLPEPFAAWRLNVRLQTGNPFLIRGNFAAGSVTGDLSLRGTLGNPLPNGTVEITDLRAALPFSTLTVRRGTLRFTPETGFDPVLEIRGTSNPRPYRVNGYVHGRMSDPQIVLTSSPPLPPNEIITLLATGATTKGLENPQAAASRALQLFAEELRRGRFVVGRQLRPLLGLLDRVDFALAEADPYSNYAYSTAMLSLTDRWFLSAGIGEDGDSRFLAIWRLTFH